MKVIQLKNAVVPNPVAPCCQNIVAMLLCGRTFQKEVREYWSMKGPKECQNYDGDFAASERQFKDQSRKFSKHLLFRKHLSGEEIALEWIVYSPSTGSIFCFICVLFGDKHITTQFQVLDSVIGSMNPVD